LAGSSDDAARVDHAHEIQTAYNDTVVPSDLGSAAAAGDDANPARRDHIHRAGGTDLAEFVQDTINSSIIAQDSLQKTYNDAQGQITLNVQSGPARATVGPNAPNSPASGELWWETDSDPAGLNVRVGTEWLDVGGGGGGGGQANAVELLWTGDVNVTTASQWVGTGFTLRPADVDDLDMFVVQAGSGGTFNYCL